MDPTGLINQPYDVLERIFDYCSDEDLVQYYHRAFVNGSGDHEAVKEYYRIGRFRGYNSLLRVTPENAAFLQNGLMPTFGQDVFKSCKIVHLVINDANHATKDEIRTVSRFCDVALRRSYKVRVLKVTGRFDETDMPPLFNKTLLRLRSVEEVYFDCHFHTFGGNPSAGFARNYWRDYFNYWRHENREIRFYFNTSKLTPEYVNAIASLNYAEVRFY